jgi:hypothetical protein
MALAMLSSHAFSPTWQAVLRVYVGAFARTSLRDQVQQ